jgi:hypothetical protein
LIKELMIRVLDYLKAGEIRFIETTPEESEAANVRLDSHRKKRWGATPKRNSPTKTALR